MLFDSIVIILKSWYILIGGLDDMNVGEYLKIINGVFGDEPLTADRIETSGFIDITPKKEDRYYESDVEFGMDGDTLVVTRTFDMDADETTLSRRIPLSDDVANYGGDRFNTTEEILETTLNAMKESQVDSEHMTLLTGEQMRDYRPMIDALTEAINDIKGDLK